MDRAGKNGGDGVADTVLALLGVLERRNRGDAGRVALIRRLRAAVLEAVAGGEGRG